MEDTDYMNSLVGDYLASVHPQLAKKFKKESKASPLLPGSPNLTEIVKEFQKTSPAKRKLSLSNGHTPAKKAKKAESSSESSSDDDSEDSGLQVKAAPVAAKAAAKPMEEDSSSEDDSSDEEEEKSKKKAKPATKAAAKKEESSSEDSDSDDEEEEAKPAVKPAAKAPAKKEESSSEDSDSDDEEEEAKPAKATAKKEESSSDDSDTDDEEEQSKPAVKLAAKAPAKKEESSSDDSDSDDEEEKATPATKKKEPEPEPELIIKNNKKKTDTPQKGGHNKSFNGQPEGKKIFVHNVSEEATYEDFQASVEKFGECTDFFNPGRGFAFIEFSTPAEANACIAGMDNTEVAGRTIQMNIAKPKGEKGEDRGGQGGRGGHNKSFSGQPEGSKIFVHNVSEEATYEDFQASVEKFGEVTDFFNPGRGFAFVEFSTPAEANACIAGMDNTEIAGRTIQMNIARPKGEKGQDRGGQSRGGGGGGGRRNDVEGAKLFVHNVSEETSQDDLRYAFESHGTVVDAYNPGKGFAFIQYSSPDEAQAAIKAMNGTNVCGRDIECNIAKPRGEKGGNRGGRGGRGGGRGGQGGRGGGRMGSGGNSISIGSGTGANKKKTFD